MVAGVPLEAGQRGTRRGQFVRRQRGEVSARERRLIAPRLHALLDRSITIRSLGSGILRGQQFLYLDDGHARLGGRGPARSSIGPFVAVEPPEGRECGVEDRDLVAAMNKDRAARVVVLVT
jgi:hypothetical protein